MDQTISIGKYRTTVRNLLHKAGVGFDVQGQRPESSEAARPTRCSNCGSVIPASSTKCLVCQKEPPR
jgi:hypothetical protein